MARSLLANDSDLVQHLHTDSIDNHDRLVITSTQDLEPVFKQVQFMQEQKHDADMKPAAVIPGVIVEQMMRDGSFNDPAALKRWLNDPQNDCFRVWKGKV